MGVISTTNKEEAEKTGKIFLSKQNLDYLNMFSYLDRCKYCKKILLKRSDRLTHYLEDKDRTCAWDYKNYCSEWCFEMEHPPKIKHVCKECGIVVEPCRRKNGNSAGVYPKYCKEHRFVWLKNKKPRKIK